MRTEGTYHILCMLCETYGEGKIASKTHLKHCPNYVILFGGVRHVKERGMLVWVKMRVERLVFHHTVLTKHLQQGWRSVRREDQPSRGETVEPSSTSCDPLLAIPPVEGIGCKQTLCTKYRPGKVSGRTLQEVK